MHNLAAAFVLGYHGCDEFVAERLLRNEAFTPSKNTFDWLGSGIYFWESNPDRALAWAHESETRRRAIGQPYVAAVVGAVIEQGFCLDLISANGITAVEEAYTGYLATMKQLGKPVAQNNGGEDRFLRSLDCAVLTYLHASRLRKGLPSFDTARGVFVEGEEIYPGAGFRRKTHVQLCVRNPAMIKGVFRVPPEHFTSS